MNELLKRPVIEENQQLLINTTPESFAQYNKWKNTILEDKSNLILLLQSFLTEDYAPSVQTFILDLILTFINTYGANLPLMEIQRSLFEINPEIVKLPYIIYKTGNVIANVIRLIYQNDSNFILEIEEDKEEMNPLECAVYCNLCSVFDENRVDCTIKQNIEAQDFFRDTPLLEYVNFAVRTLNVTPELSVKLLLSCLQFRQYAIINYTPDFIMQLLNKSLFENLKIIVQNGSPEIGCTAIKAVTYLSQCKAAHIQPEIENGIIGFISFIVDSPEFFEDQSRVIEFGNLIDMNRIMQPALMQELLDFILVLISNDFIKATYLLNPFLEYYKRYTRFLADDSMDQQFSTILQNYVQNGLESFQNNPNETYSTFFQDLEHSFSTIETLLSGSQKSCIEAADNIAQILTDISEQPFSVTTNLQLGFLLQIARSAINNPIIFEKISQKIEGHPNLLKNLIEAVFTLMLSTQDNVLTYYSQMAEIEAPFPFELSMILFIKDFYRQYFNEYLTRETDIFATVPCFENQEQFLCATFSRLWLDLINNIESKTISTVIMYMDNKIIRKIGENESSSIANDMLQNYMEYPSKSLIFEVVCKIIVLNHEKKRQFYQSLLENFPSTTTDEGLLKKLFIILKSLFILTKSPEEFKELYIFFSDNYSQLALSADSHTLGKTILKLLMMMFHSRFPTNPFDRKTPYRFNVFHFVTQVLEKYSNELLDELPEVASRDFIGIEEVKISNAISLSEAHSMQRTNDLDNTRLKIGQNNWNFVTYIIKTLNLLMESPFPNWGIIAYYQDSSHFRILNVVMQKIGYDSPKRAYDLLSIPDLIPEILNFYSACLKFLDPSQIPEDHFHILNTFSRVALASYDEEIIQKACKVLLNLVEPLSKLNMLESIHPHVIFSVNILLSTTQPNAIDFLTTFSQKNNEYLPELIDHIAENLPPQYSEGFRVLYHQLMKDCPPPNHKDFITEYGRRLTQYFQTIQDMNIHINHIPDLEPYFSFPGPPQPTSE